MKKEQLLELVAQGLTTKEIAKVVNKAGSTITYWLKKHDVSLKRARNKTVDKTHKTCTKCKVNLEISYFYKRSSTKYQSACKRCCNLNRTIREKKPRKPYVATQETRDKLSKIRKEFLRNNPDKHNWKSNNKFKSIPCEHLKEYLRENNICFLEEHSISQERFYSIDIAFPHKMIALEVNGRQHYDDSNQLKPYYQERHDYIKSLGWTIIELYYAKVFQKKFKEDLLNSLLSQGITQEQIDLLQYFVPKTKKVVIKKGRYITPSKIKHSLEDVLEIVKELGFKKSESIIGCSDTTIRKFLKRNNIDPKEYGYYKYRKNLVEA